MGRRVFLDVGAHRGQSLEAVITLGFFDWIVCFEPVSSLWPTLKGLALGRARIEPFGLWNRDCETTVYDPGTKGAGMWVKDKRLVTLDGDRPEQIICEFRRARDWFAKHVSLDDTVFLKLNCEGAECDIIDDLIDSGEFEKVTYVMVDFDSVKIRNLKHRMPETKARLAPYGKPRVLFSKEVMSGPTHQDRIRNWLRVTGGIPSLNCG